MRLVLPILLLLGCGPKLPPDVDAPRIVEFTEFGSHEVKLWCTDVRTGYYLDQTGLGVIEFEWCNDWVEVEAPE